MQCPALLEFSHPDIAKGHAPFVAPPAHGLETVGNVTGVPVLKSAISKGDEPDVFPEPLGRAQVVEVAAGPDVGP